MSLGVLVASGVVGVSVRLISLSESWGEVGSGLSSGFTTWSVGGVAGTGGSVLGFGLWRWAVGWRAGQKRNGELCPVALQFGHFRVIVAPALFLSTYTEVR